MPVRAGHQAPVWHRHGTWGWLRTLLPPGTQEDGGWASKSQNSRAPPALPNAQMRGASVPWSHRLPQPLLPIPPLLPGQHAGSSQGGVLGEFSRPTACQEPSCQVLYLTGAGRCPKQPPAWRHQRAGSRPSPLPPPLLPWDCSESILPSHLILGRGPCPTPLIEKGKPQCPADPGPQDPGLCPGCGASSPSVCLLRVHTQS